MTYYYLFGLLKNITSLLLSLPYPRPVKMRAVLALAMIGMILVSHPAIGAGGLEIEVGDVQGNETGPNLNNGKQDETEKARLKAVDEKLRRAEEEGSRPAAEGSGTGSGPPDSSQYKRCQALDHWWQQSFSIAGQEVVGGGVAE